MSAHKSARHSRHWVAVNCAGSPNSSRGPRRSAQRLTEAAEAAGANAVLAMRYDSNELAGTFQEILAYGTAVVIETL